MKKIHILLFILFVMPPFLAAATDNTLTDQEKQDGWGLLFDGESTNGWMSNQDKPFPKDGWVVEDGTLTMIPGSKAGDIITEQSFGNFELVLDFKYARGANSGIKYFIQKGSSIGCEYQVLDDENHPDSKMGVNNNRQVAALYDILPPAEKTVKPVGEWNRAKIVVKDGHVEHWLNGAKVLEYERYSPTFRQLLLHSKFKNEDKFATWKTGHILLQDHGDKVSFKNIKIHQLD